MLENISVSFHRTIKSQQSTFLQCSLAHDFMCKTRIHLEVKLVLRVFGAESGVSPGECGGTGLFSVLLRAGNHPGNKVKVSRGQSFHQIQRGRIFERFSTMIRVLTDSDRCEGWSQEDRSRPDWGESVSFCNKLLCLSKGCSYSCVWMVNWVLHWKSSHSVASFECLLHVPLCKI